MRPREGTSVREETPKKEPFTIVASAVAINGACRQESIIDDTVLSLYFYCISAGNYLEYWYWCCHETVGVVDVHLRCSHGSCCHRLNPNYALIRFILLKSSSPWILALRVRYLRSFGTKL
ncbi:uncharacterized protein LOC110267965 [Arachis ipaensis]|uniref:uncharacterized protein LOC110267965 n=1 Tax=Arachis ipaensis TaxID=130454 RepID=UPI000A2B7597|nr:uncharacterized protein LOC110267965 [Arachis ipaensis]